MQTVGAADGRILCFAEWGDFTGVPVLSMHGTPGCRLLGSRKVECGLEDLLRSLGIRLVTYDRPGYGRSGRQHGRVVADTAADVAMIADALGIDEFSVQGGSSGAAHALAIAALLGSRVRRVVCEAPMAPYEALGAEEWSRDQAAGVRSYVAACLEGEERLTAEVAAEDVELRARASTDEPTEAEVFEQTRDGLGGWIDDELAVLQAWGFEPAAIAAPTRVYYNPNDLVLPPQHAEWLARTIPNASLAVTTVLGHGAEGDPREDWSQLYSWLAA